MASRQISSFPIEVKGQPRVLRLETSKAPRGGVSTTATVVNAHGDGSFSFVLFHDFYKTVAAAPCRATQQAIERLHAQSLNTVDEIKAAAIAHYATKEVA